MTQSLERHARAAPQADGPLPVATIDRLVAEIRASNNDEKGRAAADLLSTALKELAVRAPTVETRDLLHRLLDGKELDGFTDSSGTSCRAAVVNAQVALGFPYALEVAPDDLLLLRKATRHAGRPMPSAVGSGALSLVWNAAFLLLLGSAVGRPYLDRGGVLLLMAPFFIGANHALAALFTGLRSKPNRRDYKVLAWMGLLGPIFSVIAATRAGSVGLGLGMILAVPAMYVAMKCGQVAARLPPEEE